MLNVSVRDTGIGIKKEDMRKLFSEFDRIEEKRNRNVEGTGLGMSITTHLLEMMDSQLEVESIYGLGYKFSFSLKQKVVKWEELGDYEQAYKDSISNREKYREKFTAPSAKLLIIDDTPMNIMVFKSLLKQTRVRIDTASSGDEGISLALENKYDIIFLDHMMPKKDGIQTLKELKAETKNPNLSTVTVCLTANAISGAREQYTEAGFDDYLTKPIDPIKLEDMLMSYLPKEKVVYSSADNEVESVAVPETDSGLPGFLYGISEIDTETGIKNCGDEETYVETLVTYADMLDDCINEIQSFYAENDIPNATIKIHALKSTSRIIGAADIGETAQELENAGKADDIKTLERGLGAFLDKCRKLSEQLEPIKTKSDEDEDDSGLPPISDEQFSEYCSLIREHAVELENECISDVLDDMKKFRLDEHQKEMVKGMSKAIDEYDYDVIFGILDGN